MTVPLPNYGTLPLRYIRRSNSSASLTRLEWQSVFAQEEEVGHGVVLLAAVLE